MGKYGERKCRCPVCDRKTSHDAIDLARHILMKAPWDQNYKAWLEACNLPTDYKEGNVKKIANELKKLGIC